MRHYPFTTEEYDFGRGRHNTRQDLLGTTLVKLPPNHVPVLDLSNWHAQRFSVILLRDVKSTLHIIPLTRADGSPFRARFEADSNMHLSLPNQDKVQLKQLHLLNKSIYI